MKCCINVYLRLLFQLWINLLLCHGLVLLGNYLVKLAFLEEGKGFIGPSDPPSEHAGIPLTEGLDPPDLIIQDELHLISGPLGSISGLYESIIDELSTKTKDKLILRPKIIASTATVKRATQQLRALFARSTNPAVFPAPGPDRKDSFFSKTVPVTDANEGFMLGFQLQDEI